MDSGLGKTAEVQHGSGSDPLFNLFARGLDVRRVLAFANHRLIWGGHLSNVAQRGFLCAIAPPVSVKVTISSIWN